MTASDNDSDRLDLPRTGSVRHAATVLASAPVRTADAGGWSDTWFAEYGLVCNVAIDQRACVRVDLDPASPHVDHARVRMTGERYEVDPSSPPGHHPMLEAAAVALAPPGATVIDVAPTIEGSGLGTSSAVLVSVVAALHVANGVDVEPDDVARLAHRFETGAGRQAGVQDHVAAAHGGVSLIKVDYPRAQRRSVQLSAATMAELERRLITVWLGSAHESSALHEQVIARCATDESTVAMDRIRDGAHLAATALERDDVDGYAAALVGGHEALDGLHPDLVGDEARAVIQLARHHGATGWKANGACGPGGSVAIVGPIGQQECRRLRAAIDARSPWRVVDAPIARHGVIARRFRFDGEAFLDPAEFQRTLDDHHFRGQR